MLILQVSYNIQQLFHADWQVITVKQLLFVQYTKDGDASLSDAYILLGHTLLYLAVAQALSVQGSCHEF
jgi:hypothetical protein